MDRRQLNDLRISLGDSNLLHAVEQNKVDTYNRSQGDDDKTGIQCDLCNNRGNIAFLTNEGRFIIRSCKCSGARLTVSRLQKQGLFETSKMKTLDNFRAETATQKALKSLVQKYIAEKEPKWMLLCGQSGAGKTHLCTAAFVKLSFDRGIDGRYLLWNSDGRRIKAAAREGNEQLFNDFKKCSLLYIDDLFKCKRDTEPSDADVRLAFEMLDYRYSHKLRTIISTEMLLEDLYNLDESIYRRIFEMCDPYIGNIGRDISKCYAP